MKKEIKFIKFDGTIASIKIPKKPLTKKQIKRLINNHALSLRNNL